MGWATAVHPSQWICHLPRVSTLQQDFNYSMDELLERTVSILRQQIVFPHRYPVQLSKCLLRQNSLGMGKFT